MDANGDGVVTLDEFKSAMRTMRWVRRGGVGPHPPLRQAR
jgi:hypothetical protein